MNAVVGMTGQGGWPMTMFLTPAGEPFHGGTYYPPEPRFGMPSFRQVLSAVDDAWRERRGEVMQAGAALAAGLRRSAEVAPSTEPLTAELLTGAMPALRSAFDPEWGGFGGAPKFPGRLDGRPASAPARAHRERRCTADGDRDARRDGPRRDARPDRRRLSPLCGRSHLARPALREDAVRQRAARQCVPGGVRRDRRAPVRQGRRGHARLSGARDAAARGRLRLVSGRRHRRRGGLDLRVDAGPARRGAGRGAGGHRRRPLRGHRRRELRGLSDGPAGAGSAAAGSGRDPGDPARAPLPPAPARPRRQGAGVMERPRSGCARAGRMAAAAARPAGRSARLRPLPARAR